MKEKEEKHTLRPEGRLLRCSCGEVFEHLDSAVYHDEVFNFDEWVNKRDKYNDRR